MVAGALRGIHVREGLHLGIPSPWYLDSAAALAVVGFGHRGLAHHQPPLYAPIMWAMVISSSAQMPIQGAVFTP